MHVPVTPAGFKASLRLSLRVSRRADAKELAGLTSAVTFFTSQQWQYPEHRPQVITSPKFIEHLLPPPRADLAGSTKPASIVLQYGSPRAYNRAPARQPERMQRDLQAQRWVSIQLGVPASRCWSMFSSLATQTVASLTNWCYTDMLGWGPCRQAWCNRS